MDSLDDLLARSRSGDRAAIEALVRASSDRLLALARRVTGDRSRAEDVVQDVFLRLLTTRRGYEGRGGASGWLTRTTARAALDVARSEASRARRERLTGMESTRIVASSEPVEPDVREALDAALAELPALTRACVWLHAVDGLSVREIGAVVARGRSAAAERVRAGLAALRVSLARRGVALDLALLASLLGASGTVATRRDALVARVVERGPVASAAATRTAGWLRGASFPAASVWMASAVGALALAAGVTVPFLVPDVAPDANPAPVARADGAAQTPASDGPDSPLIAAPLAVSDATEAPLAAPHGARLFIETVDEAGEPIGDVYVEIRPLAPMGSERIWGLPGMDVIAVRSDASGRAAVEDLEPWRYRVSGVRFDACGVESDVELPAGQDADVRVEMKPTPFLRGRAFLGSRDSVLALAELEVGPDHGYPCDPVAHTDVNGRFLFGPRQSMRQIFHLRYRECRVARLRLGDDGVSPDGEIDVIFQPGVTAEGEIREPGGMPLVGVELEWRREGDALAEALYSTTDSRGRYRLRGLAPGRWSVLFMTGVPGSTGDDPAEEIVLDDPVHSASFVLDCEPMVEVRTVVATGEPAGGVEIRVLCERRNSGGQTRQFTDPDGTLLLANAWRDAELEVSIEDARYTGQPVRCSVADRNGPLTIVLQPRPALRGRVVSSDGAPLSDALVSVFDAKPRPVEVRMVPIPFRRFDSTPAPLQWAKTDADGRFECFLDPGEYRFVVHAGELGAGVASAEIPRDGAPPDDVMVRVDAASSLRIRFLDPGFGPWAVRVSFPRLDEAGASVGSLTAESDEDGWCVAVAPPGLYGLDVTSVRGVPSAIRYDDVELRPGDPPLVLELPEPAPALRGVVLHEGRPVPHARVGYGQGEGPIAGVTDGVERADEAGRFVIPFIDRRWFADPIVIHAWGPDFALATSGPVHLSEGETTEVEVRSLDGEDLTARLVDPSGTPVLRVRALFWRPGTRRTVYEAVADEGGTIRVPRLPAMRYEVRVEGLDQSFRRLLPLTWPDDRPADSGGEDGAALTWTIAPRS